MEKQELNVQPRAVMGKKVKILREQGLVPGVIYGREFSSRPVQVPLKDFERTYTEAGESTLVYLKLDKENLPTIIQDVTLDPVTSSVLHVDFYKVRLDEKIHATVALRFIGESTAVKDLEGILVKNIQEVEVVGFPQDLPHEIDVDISTLKNIDDQLLIKDLNISDNVNIDADADDIVVLVQAAKSEEELEKDLESTQTSVEDVKVLEKEKKEEEPTEEKSPE